MGGGRRVRRGLRGAGLGSILRPDEGVRAWGSWLQGTRESLEAHLIHSQLFAPRACPHLLDFHACLLSASPAYFIKPKHRARCTDPAPPTHSPLIVPPPLPTSSPPPLPAPQRERFAKYSESFNREAEVLARLNHPNIIRMYGMVVEGAAGHEAVAGIMTEFVRNGSLTQLLR